MSGWLALSLMLGEPGASATGGLVHTPVADAPGSPAAPIVGRPVDFSGALGGPFVVQWIAQPTEVTAEEPLTLALRIIGPGNLRNLSRPDLAKLDSFKAFAVEDLDDQFMPGDPPRREFRYRVRPRSAAVREIPRFKFVYFNPQIVPPSRGFQTTYADPVPLIVNARAISQPTVPAEAPEWMLAPPSSDELLWPPPKAWQEWLERICKNVGIQTGESLGGGEWLTFLLALLVPPTLCGTWLVLWRRRSPNATHIAAGRRSRAAAVALRALERLGTERPELVAAALVSYLRDRAGLPATASTPAEIGAGLTAFGCSPALVEVTVAFFRRCDAARFGPSLVDATLAEDGAKTIAEWEAPCPGLA